MLPPVPTFSLLNSQTRWGAAGPEAAMGSSRSVMIAEVIATAAREENSAYWVAVNSKLQSLDR